MSVGMIGTGRIEAMVAQLKAAAARANPAADAAPQARQAAGAVDFGLQGIQRAGGVQRQDPGFALGRLQRSELVVHECGVEEMLGRTGGHPGLGLGL